MLRVGVGIVEEVVDSAADSEESCSFCDARRRRPRAGLVLRVAGADAMTTSGLGGSVAAFCCDLLGAVSFFAISKGKYHEISMAQNDTKAFSNKKYQIFVGYLRIVL